MTERSSGFTEFTISTLHTDYTLSHHSTY